MAHYQVQYSISDSGEYIYPDALEGVVWRSTTYDLDKETMIGETDADVSTDGDDVVELKPAQAKRLRQKLERAAAAKKPPDQPVRRR